MQISPAASAGPPARGNLLVHGYAEVDDRKVRDALAGLDDLRDYAAAVDRAISG
jgi:uncharacterized protein YutE (UPF0331/DUF86 family)